LKKVCTKLVQLDPIFAEAGHHLVL
jgi:hypothetical protein